MMFTPGQKVLLDPEAVDGDASALAPSTVYTVCSVHDAAAARPDCQDECAVPLLEMHLILVQIPHRCFPARWFYPDKSA